MIWAPGTGWVLSRRASSASAGGQLEQPSLVNSSTITGAGAVLSSARANPLHKSTGIRNFFMRSSLGLSFFDSKFRGVLRKPDVLHFLFQLEAEAGVHARF